MVSTAEDLSSIFTNLKLSLTPSALALTTDLRTPSTYHKYTTTTGSTKSYTYNLSSEAS